jgi:hypothetical protein
MTNFVIKKIVAGTYDMVVNNNTYEIYQDLNLFDKGWKIYLTKINGEDNLEMDRWCDTVDSLKYAKECILKWETKKENQ